MSLRKDDNTTIDIHITHFNQLLQDVEYHKFLTIACLESEVINLQFMISLGEI